MTREEILGRIKALEPWFHQIDLGGGIYTKTSSAATEPVDHPALVWKVIKKCLPSDLSGMDVLDVGCNAGFYAVEAKRRGARRVLGVDAGRHHIRQALFVKKALGLDIEYQRMSAYDLDPHIVGRFDVTLALGLIYHCKHPMLALEKLARVTKEKLIIETAILPAGMLASRLTYDIGGATLSLYPAAYLENDRSMKEEVFNWFLPTVEGLTAMLRAVGFSDVEAFDVRDDRAVLVCTKQAEYADSFIPEELAAELALLDGVEECDPGAEIHLRVRARNSGFARWLAAGEPLTGRASVHLAVHILDDDGEDLYWDHARSGLQEDIAPGEAGILDITFSAPDRAGNYLLELDMVSEHITWFENAGSKTLRVPLRVVTPTK